MACNHDCILITFDYLSLKIIFKPIKRFNTQFMWFGKKNISILKHYISHIYDSILNEFKPH